MTSWEKAFADRLGEPLHLNALSVLVRLFGGFRAKVAFDLVERRRYAYPLLKAADEARALGINRMYALEFGVAAGAGLVNLVELGTHVTRETGVAIDVVGFDAGTGMPPPADYRDYPDQFISGDFPTPDLEALAQRLPANARLEIGPVAERARQFAEQVDAPIGFISFDLAYYSSTVEAMAVLAGPADHYLPLTLGYLGAIRIDQASPAVGERLAVAEHNQANPLRPIHPFTNLRQKRIFQRAEWIDQIQAIHILDHPRRSGSQALERGVWELDDPLSGR
ncbi:MAG: hypothetical protein ACO37Y_11975 [Steroidobacteraceae bacterium]